MTDREKRMQEISEEHRNDMRELAEILHKLPDEIRIRFLYQAQGALLVQQYQEMMEKNPA